MFADDMTDEDYQKLKYSSEYEDIDTSNVIIAVPTKKIVKPKKQVSKTIPDNMLLPMSRDSSQGVSTGAKVGLGLLGLLGLIISVKG